MARIDDPRRTPPESPSTAAASSGRRVRSTIDIDAPASEVWPLISQFSHWPEWGPTVRAVESRAHEVAEGVTGRVQTPIGVWLPFEISEVIPERSWDWRVAGIPATGHVLISTGTSTSRVEFTVPTWGAPYTVILRAGLRRLTALAEAS